MRQALELALEALERSVATCFDQRSHDAVMGRPEHFVNRAITAIKEALAQSEQEPVAWATREDFYRELDRSVERIRKEMEVKSVTMRCKDYDVVLPIINTHFGRVLVGQVSTPPQRTWVGLTDEEIDQGLLRSDYAFKTAEAWRAGVVFAMTKLKEKNT